MKYLVLFLSFAIIGCAHNRSLNVPDTSPKEEYAILKHENTIKIDKIDGVRYHRGLSIFLSDIYRIKMTPGIHEFEFRYDAVSDAGIGSKMLHNVTRSFDLKAGKEYELTHEIKNHIVRFHFKEVVE